MVIVHDPIMDRLIECDAVTDNDNIVDLSSSVTTSTTNSRSQSRNETNVRILRPRNEMRNYAESPERLLNGMNNISCTNFYENENYLTNGIDNSDDDDFYSKLDRNRFNNKKKIRKFTYLNSRSIADKQFEGDGDTSVDDSPLPSPPLPKPIDPKKQETLRRLRDELRTEEMKLLLLRKLRHSQLQHQHSQSTHHNTHKDKEKNSNFLSHHIIPPTILPSGLSITPATTKVSSSINKQCSNLGRSSMTISKSTTVSRGNSMSGKTNLNSGQNRGLNISVPQPPNRLFNSSNTSRSNSLGNFTVVAKELQPSVTITPAPPPAHKDRNRDDNQTPAQHKAAAKSALRKQLEKTLLQMSPPKPPAPEMHFIPNPSNSEFIYLLGLEVVVDYITNENRPQPEAKVHPIFECCQCNRDFTPVWKPDMIKNRSLNDSHIIFYHPQNFIDNGVDEHSVLCEDCVTKNVKKVLKAEHTNRLKTAFVKALQQEQEIDQNLSQNGITFTTPSPVSSPDDIQFVKSISNNQNTSSTSVRHVPTPPANVSLPTPSPRHAGSTSNHNTNNNSNSNNNNNNSNSTISAANAVAATAAAAQAMQILRGLTNSQSVTASNNHLPSLSHFLYPYQLAMAQGTVSSATSSTSTTINNSNSNNNKTLPAITNPPFTLADLQRFADIQKQCIMDLMPFQLTNSAPSSTATANTTSTTSSSSTRHSNWKT